MRHKSDSAEIDRLRHALFPHVAHADQFNNQDIAMALYGLQN
jgi:hypothetical protein